MGVELESGSGPKRVRPQMNITPLVDVVLVLLIIFMVVTPLLTKQLWLNVPPKVEDEAPPPPPGALPPLVLTVERDGVTKVNGEVIAREELAPRLVRMLNARPDKVVFFDADSSMDYGAALEVMDLVRGGGVETLAVLAEESVAAVQASASPAGTAGSP
ncbi:MAG: ExbD/TolR family protein [Myxococcota bacterium]